MSLSYRFSRILPLLFLCALVCGCGDEPIRPSVAFTPPRVTAVIETQIGDGWNVPSGIRTAENGTMFIQDRNTLVVLDAEGHYLRTIPVFGAYRGHDWRYAVSDASVFVLEPWTKTVSVYNWGGTFLRSFHFEGTEPVNDAVAFDIAVDRSGRIFVFDPPRRRVQRFSPQGVVETEWGARGIAPSQFEGPCLIQTDPDGNLCMLDLDLWRVQRFSPDGSMLQVWTLTRTVQYGLDLRGRLTVDRQGRPIVTDIGFLPGSLTVLALDGTTASSWPLPGEAPRFDDLLDVYDAAVARSGELLFVDPNAARVARYSDAGAFLGDIGHRYGTEPGEIQRVDRVVSTGPDRFTYLDREARRLETFDTAGRRVGVRSVPAYLNDRILASDTAGRVYFQVSDGTLFRASVDNDDPSVALFNPEPAEFLYDLKVSQSGRLGLLLLDRSADRQHFDLREPDGTLLESWPLPAAVSYRGMGFDPAGEPWFINNSGVSHLNLRNGTLESFAWPFDAIGVEPCVPSGTRRLCSLQPLQLAWSKDWTLYVTEFSGRILVFDRILTYRGEFGADALDLYADGFNAGFTFCVTPGGAIVAGHDRTLVVFEP